MEPRLAMASDCSQGIREMAGKAHAQITDNPLASKLARRARLRPIDYMRWAEFDAILQMLALKPGQQVLDVASPQWFTLFLASRYPDTQFHYINILESEVNPYKSIGTSLGIRNLEYGLGDIRNLTWPSGTFDTVISISVLEHVYPEVGGDVSAFQEIHRVLKAHGSLALTMPCKAQRNIVYNNGAVYERGKQEKNFFAREYDMESFHELAESTGFLIEDEWRIEERPGLFAVDYWEWAEGSKKGLWPWVVRNRGRIERVARRSFDEMLAKSYLRLSKESTARLVNVAAKLRPKAINAS